LFSVEALETLIQYFSLTFHLTAQLLFSMSVDNDAECRKPDEHETEEYATVPLPIEQAHRAPSPRHGSLGLIVVHALTISCAVKRLSE
jgi:hypothetical protein